MGPFSLGVNSQLEEGTQHCRWLHCAQRESLSRAWAPLAGPRWQLQATCTVPEYLRESFSGYEPGLEGQLGHAGLL